MNGPPRKEGAPAKSAFRKLQLRTAFPVTTFHTKLLEGLLCFFEQRHSRLVDLLDNERGAQ
jgi:hypothetical protein